MKFYEYLEEKAFERNLTMHNLAIEVGMKPSTLYAVKYRNPSTATYHKLANYFEMDVKELRDIALNSER